MHIDSTISVGLGSSWPSSEQPGKPALHQNHYALANRTRRDVQSKPSLPPPCAKLCPALNLSQTSYKLQRMNLNNNVLDTACKRYLLRCWQHLPIQGREVNDWVCSCLYSSYVCCRRSFAACNSAAWNEVYIRFTYGGCRLQNENFNLKVFCLCF